MQPTVEPEEAVNLAHPLGVARGEVVVDGDDVDAAARQRVEVRGKRGDERLALARAHLGDLALVEHDAADELHVEVAHAGGAHARLAHGGEGFGQKLVERGPLDPLALRFVRDAFDGAGDALLELDGARAQLLVREALDGGLQFVNPPDDGLDRFQEALVAAPENLGQNFINHGVLILQVKKGRTGYEGGCCRLMIGAGNRRL